MDNASFVVRHGDTGKPADDLVVGISEARSAMSLAAADLATAGATAIGLAANAATIAAQTWIGLASATATQIGDKAHAINTTGKTKGKMVYNTTTDLIYFAIGTTDTAKWRLTGAVDATGDITPS